MSLIDAIIGGKLSDIWAVATVVLALLIAGGVCVACSHLHERLQKIEAADLLKRISQIESKFKEEEKAM